MEKPLVIKVKPASIPNGTPGKWEDLSGNIEKFTADIETPAIDENSDISAQVSGIWRMEKKAKAATECVRIRGFKLATV